MTQYTRHTNPGFTLTEMLIVISIVVTLTALSVPFIAQTGFFTSDKTKLAGRDLYQMLRAARLYATTNNVETALVYRTRFVYETANDEVDATDITPVIDGYAICRRLTEDEILSLNDFFDETAYPDGQPPLEGEEIIYIPIEEGNGRFREMPETTAVLGEVFEVNADGDSVNGLMPVFVVDPFVDFTAPTGSPFFYPTAHILDPFGDDGVNNDGDGGTDEPDEAERLHYEMGDGDISTEDVTETALALQTLANGDQAPVHAFPAHRFAPTGEVITTSGLQRFEMPIGLAPDQQPEDRFVIGDDSTVIYEVDPNPGTAGEDSDVEEVSIQFHRHDTGADPALTEIELRFYDPRRIKQNPAPPPEFVVDRDPDVDGFNQDVLIPPFLLENTTTVVLYASTGRVKVESDT